MPLYLLSTRGCISNTPKMPLSLRFSSWEQGEKANHHTLTVLKAVSIAHSLDTLTSSILCSPVGTRPRYQRHLLCKPDTSSDFGVWEKLESIFLGSWVKLRLHFIRTIYYLGIHWECPGAHEDHQCPLEIRTSMSNHKVF